jgi:hypothetical protein
MSFSKILVRTLLAFVATVVVQAVAGILVPMQPFAAPHMMLWLMASNALTVAALAVVASRSEWRGWRLGAAVAAIPLVLAFINFIDGVVYLPNAHLDWGRIFLFMLVSAVLSVPVWALLFGRGKEISIEHRLPTRSWGEHAWRFLLADLLYLVLYFVAGSIIYPYIRNFYTTQHVPPFLNIVALQFLIRGPMFVLCCLGLVRMIGLPGMRGAIVAGVVFAVLSGVAPLLIPNPVFPDVVRWAHLCEVSSENFVLIAFVAWVWGMPGRNLARVTAAA